ncbi:MAG: 1-deoxy-D-xylulose-5-phosphate reductoisomerase [Firmicutes bacterium]|nr:1-deoxy-D-xylulose-5-phosphate reductoisomerase [Candidatus Fiminaster equi]
MDQIKKVLLLGASGSIGGQTIDIIDEANGKFVLTAFSVGNNWEKAKELLERFKTVKHVYVKSFKHALKLHKLFPHVKFYFGKHGLASITRRVNYDICVDALVGFVGLEPAVIALKRNRVLCLANKEALVAGGTIINDLLSKGKGKLFPIDSEHVALAKCLANCDSKDVKRLIITASGGALRNVPLDKLNDVKAEEALKHPTWKMGNKITIDCATMMNKGFEIIEAYYLYGYPLDKITVQMHDESLVHSAVELNDGTLIVDYGKPDMHNPIRWALYEGKCEYEVLKLKSFSELKDCHFHDYDPVRYPCTEIAKHSLLEGASKMIALNASNEVLVHKYLNNEINFLDIAKNVEIAVNNTKINTHPTLRQVKSIDKRVRKAVE